MPVRRATKVKAIVEIVSHRRNAISNLPRSFKLQSGGYPLSADRNVTVERAAKRLERRLGVVPADADRA
jgi:hypothetical protein